MAELSRLKKFMLCTFIVAVASFVVMFYYSVSFSKYTRIGVNYVTTIKDGELGRFLYEHTLLSNDSSASSSKQSYTPATSEEGAVEPSARSQPTEKNSIMTENKTALQSTSNSPKKGSTDRLSTEAVKPITSTTTQPILTTTNTRSNITQELCPEKSSSLGEPFFFYLTLLVT